MNETKEYSLEQNIILLSIDPEYSRCRLCNKLTHVKKNAKLQNDHFFKEYVECFVCTFNSLSWKRTPEDIHVSQIEEIYGNIYTIQFRRAPMHNHLIIRCVANA